MRIATWNINSVRLRQGLLAKVARATRADILCLQETKVDDPLFPLEALKKLGFPHIHYVGQKSYNGVAILSKVPLKKTYSDEYIKEHKRHIAAQLPDGTWLHNFYVPAGGDIPDVKVNQKYKEKLKFVDGMRDWAGTLKAKDKVVIVGDFNIAPHEHDVWSHKQLLDVVSHTPAETSRLIKLQEQNEWVDCARETVPLDKKLYSWWSYRNQDWAKSDRGRRLDHIWITPNLKKRLGKTTILRDFRSEMQPSDHVPVVMELTD